MKRVLLSLALLATLLLALPASAQQAPRSMPIAGTADDPSPYFGIDPTFLVPLGDISDLTGVGMGLLGRVEIPLAVNSNFTVRGGYIFGLKSNGSSIDHAPVMAGFRFFPAGGSHYGGGFFLMPELGAMFQVLRLQGQDNDWKLRAGASFGLGYQVSRTVLQAGVLFPHLGDTGAGVALTAGVGISF